MKLMYISNGEMFLFDGCKPRAIPSQRVEQYRRTLRQLETQHAWKSEGTGAQFMQKSNPYANAENRYPCEVTGCIPHKGGVLYSVSLGHETGGFYTKNPYDPDEPEGLVFSAVRLYVRDLTRCGGDVYAALDCAPESHVIRLDPDTGRYEQLTEGDTVERHPFAADGVLYFDMRGYARNSDQQLVGLGPSAIATLNLLTGEIEEHFSDTETDYLKYTEAPDGTRRMLVRPHRSGKSAANPLGCLLAPFSAIMGFVHVFSSINAARNGKKPPLKTSDGEAAQTMDNRLTVDGVLIDLKKIDAENKKHGDEYPGLLPRDWRLVKINPDSSLETLQHGVLDYMPLPDGGYIYSNGAHVFRVESDGTRSMLFKAHLATGFTLLD